MAEKTKCEIHLHFDLSDNLERQAYELLTTQSTPRKRSEFLVSVISAYQNNIEIAKLIAEILAQGGSTKFNSLLPGQQPIKRKRGRPPKNPSPPIPQASETQVVLPPAKNEPAPKKQTQPAEAGEDNSNELLGEILSTFG